MALRPASRTHWAPSFARENRPRKLPSVTEGSPCWSSPKITPRTISILFSRLDRSAEALVAASAYSCTYPANRSVFPFDFALSAPERTLPMRNRAASSTCPLSCPAQIVEAEDQLTAEPRILVENGDCELMQPIPCQQVANSECGHRPDGTTDDLQGTPGFPALGTRLAERHELAPTDAFWNLPRAQPSSAPSRSRTPRPGGPREGLAKSELRRLLASRTRRRTRPAVLRDRSASKPAIRASTTRQPLTHSGAVEVRRNSRTKPAAPGRPSHYHSLGRMGVSPPGGPLLRSQTKSHATSETLRPAHGQQ